MGSRSFLRQLLAPFYTERMKGYAICTAPRSGSNFLCQLLASTGKLGAPLEYFNGSSRRVLDDPFFPDDPRKQIEKILTSGATSNRTYGLKLFMYQNEQVSREIPWVDLLPDLHFISLHRNDVIGQAISWSRAEQTGQYRASQSAKAVPVYSAEHIATQIQRIRHENSGWEAYFEANNIHPLRLIYEEVEADPQSAIDGVATFIGVDGPCLVDLKKVSVVRQSDSVSSAWREQFAKDMPNLVR
jgi:LPS sulfotransferase NodH